VTLLEYFTELDPWNIVEEGFHPEQNRYYESIMSLGNGYMGMRGNFEESFSGNTLKGIYLAGIYYPDKTKVGWWKNGYPEYFAKVISSIDFLGIRIYIDGEILDIAKTEIKNFMRVLNMKQGYLTRKFIIIDQKKREIAVEVTRFLSASRKECAAISYSITPLHHNPNIIFVPYLDGNVRNEDSNHGETFWEKVDNKLNDSVCCLTMKTKKLDFCESAAMKYSIVQDGIPVTCIPEPYKDEMLVGHRISLNGSIGKTVTFYKYVAVTNNRYFDIDKLADNALNIVDYMFKKGFDLLFKEHSKAWEKRWESCDIVIDGDFASQQGIRFNIFHLLQTYTGEDSRLNIGPKGFTGEKYGGSTYWDTEAFCLPFYLGTQEQDVSRNLLLYRYKHLEKAKLNAKKLGLKGALYPMVTMDGEECHNEWEITFEEIHRNAAISYAIFNYVRYTGDELYLVDYGFEVLVETSRFWASRVNYNPSKDKYMILGVTGPNEYENNVNNNWYTNKMAAWNLGYTQETLKLIKNKFPDKYEVLVKKFKLSDKELLTWSKIIKKMYYPYVQSLNIFEQQDGYMDKELVFAKDILPEDLPLCQNWSWDRILRSCFIKQADVLQGIFFLNDEFDIETKKRNFDFYEPMTVHESSLSPCVHSVIASELGYNQKAFELFFRASRLDLDNHNNDTEDGLHITSMAGSWMSIVYGFGGLRVKEGILYLNPSIPKPWNSYSFKLLFRGCKLKVTVSQNNIKIDHECGGEIKINILRSFYLLHCNQYLSINLA
jgi:maltose phosphorylase